MPWEQINDNLLINIQLLKAFHLENIKRLVYIGSATLYQEFTGSIKECQLDLNQDPHPAYLGLGWVFRFIEKLCQFWHTQTGIEIIIIRAANIFGPYARFNPQTSNFIPAIIRKAVDRMDPFEVWGTSEVIRDVLYIEDFARAVTMILGNSKIKFDIFNIGSGVGTTVDEVVSWALKYTGHNPDEIRYNSQKPTTIRYRVLDCSKAKEQLGWAPRYTAEEGIRLTIEWWLKNIKRWKR